MRKHQWKYAIILKRCHLVHCPHSASVEQLSRPLEHQFPVVEEDEFALAIVDGGLARALVHGVHGALDVALACISKGGLLLG